MFDATVESNKQVPKLSLATGGGFLVGRTVNCHDMIAIL